MPTKTKVSATIEDVPSENTVSLLIENAVLKTAQALRKEFNELLTQNHTDTKQLVVDLHDSYREEVKETTEKADKALAASEANNQKITGLEKKLSNIWAKIIALVATATTLGGTVGFFIAQLTKNGG